MQELSRNMSVFAVVPPHVVFQVIVFLVSFVAPLIPPPAGGCKRYNRGCCVVVLPRGWPCLVYLE